jgi:hypothetical protein
MSDAKQKWDEVGDRFGELASHVKARFDAQVAFGEADREKVNDALRQIRDALDAGFTALGDSLRDTGVRDELKQASTAVVDAVASTFQDIADELRKVGKRDVS